MPESQAAALSRGVGCGTYSAVKTGRVENPKMHIRALVSVVVAMCLMHIPAMAADGGRTAPPVPVAKPATPVADTTKVIADGDGKPGEPAHGTRMPRASGPLPNASAERASNAAECIWTGRRVVSLLTKDDVDAASQFTRFYSMFGCPAPHIGTALGCYVAWDGQATHEEKLEICWNDPSGKRPVPASTAEAPREAGKDPGKPGNNSAPIAGSNANDEKPPAKN
jgi:hypothetical protein